MGTGMVGGVKRRQLLTFRAKRATPSFLGSFVMFQGPLRDPGISKICYREGCFLKGFRCISKSEKANLFKRKPCK